jgi:hypothetical protein
MLTRSLVSLAAGVLPLLAASVLASSSQAAPPNVSTKARAIAAASEAAPAPGTATPAPGTPVPTSENVVGIVKSVNGNQLEIKLPDGQIQLYEAPPSFSTSSLTPGSFVQATLDPTGKTIQDIKIPSVSKVLSGVIKTVNGEEVTLELADGTTEVTTINEATAERMNLTPGVPLTVTSYTGIPETKLCPTLLATCCQKPADPVVLPVAPPTLGPTGGGNPRPPRPQMW